MWAFKFSQLGAWLDDHSSIPDKVNDIRFSTTLVSIQALRNGCRRQVTSDPMEQRPSWKTTRSDD